MPLQATSGAASYDAFGGGAAAVPQYIEEVFSTYAYDGTTTGITITNGIDLSGKGGLVWCKSRGSSSYNHRLFDTANGVNKFLASDNVGALSSGTSLTAFNSNGFTLAASDGLSYIAPFGSPYISWTFRKQPKFFDVVTWTGNGTTRAITHNLGSTPGCIIVKSTSVADNWFVYHRSLSDNSGDPYFLYLNTTAAQDTGGGAFGTPTSTTFTVRNGSTNSNAATYVAYLFAHNAGGFGLTGTDNVISCGSFTGSASVDTTVSVGFEPQWLLFKNTASADNWRLVDNLRGMPLPSSDTALLFPNTSGAETSVAGNLVFPTSTGFVWRGTSGIPVAGNHIYIAIRRGPMKVPTTGTSVFGLSARSGTGANATVTGGQTDDAVLIKNRGSAVASLFASRLTGLGFMETSSTTAEALAGSSELRQPSPWDLMDGVKVGTTSTRTNASGNTFINYLFKRAPSFMDVVCYSGVGGMGQTLNHNLSVIPNMMIIKCRSAASTDWFVWHDGILTNPTRAYTVLNSTAASAESFTLWGSTIPTKSAFFVAGTAANGTNASGATFAAYLFATCAGVSKVFSYTGNGSSQTINCGFTAGSRWIMIKRTDSTGDWYVWDSARGIIAGNDPHLSLNTTAAEVTTDDSVDTDNTGFIVNQLAATNINVTSATYIGIAIA